MVLIELESRNRLGHLLIKQKLAWCCCSRSSYLTLCLGDGEEQKEEDEEEEEEKEGRGEKVKACQARNSLPSSFPFPSLSFFWKMTQFSIEKDAKNSGKKELLLRQVKGAKCKEWWLPVITPKIKRCDPSNIFNVWAIHFNCIANEWHSLPLASLSVVSCWIEKEGFKEMGLKGENAAFAISILSLFHLIGFSRYSYIH